MRSLRLRAFVAVLSLAAAAACAELATEPSPVSAGSSGGGGGIWVQTMDSCKQALGGATYVLSGAGVSATATTPAGGPGSVGPATGCPLEQGSCGAQGHGCVSFAIPAPGTYTLRPTTTPPANATNPEGYAPCEGGSACRSEVATVTVGAGGSVRATVTNVYPDGTTVTWPSTGAYAASTRDPIVFHDFGLAAPGSASNSQCDGDSDADDHLTGTPSSRCAFPEALEGSACQPFPWSCTLPGGSAAGAPAANSGGAAAGTQPSGPPASGHPARSTGGTRPTTAPHHVEQQRPHQRLHRSFLSL
jgi:hypothetical protein